jgi:hypothetical protein
MTHNNRMQQDFGELALTSATDAGALTVTRENREGYISYA